MVNDHLILQLTFIFDECHLDSRVIISEYAENEIGIQLLRRGNHDKDEICLEIRDDKKGSRMACNYIEFNLLQKGLTALQCYDQMAKIDEKLKVKPMHDIVDNIFDKLPRTPEKEREREIFLGLYKNPLESERAYYDRNKLNYSTYQTKRLRYNLPAKEVPRKLVNTIRRRVTHHKLDLCNDSDCPKCDWLKHWLRTN